MADKSGHRLRKRTASAPLPHTAAKRQKTTAAGNDGASEEDANGDVGSIEEAGSGDGKNGDSSNGQGRRGGSGSDDGSMDSEEDPNDALRKRVPAIEKMDPAAVVVFFKEWTANHPVKTWSEWLDFYVTTAKPAFYHDDEWDEIIDRHKAAEEVGDPGESERLKALRSIMLKLVESGDLLACSSPDVFMKTAEWKTFRAGLETQGTEQEVQDVQECDQLREEMLKQAIAKGVEPSVLHDFIFHEDWSQAIRRCILPPARATMRAQMRIMILGVLAGNAPYRYTDYFKVMEWHREVSANGYAHTNQIMKLQDQMRQAVYAGQRAPYGPDWILRLSEWGAAIRDAKGERLAVLQALFKKHRAEVFAKNVAGGQILRMCTIEAAETADWLAKWDMKLSYLIQYEGPDVPMEDPIDNIAVDALGEDVKHYDSEYGERIPILDQGANESVQHYWAKLRAWVSTRKNHFDSETWVKAILENPDHAEKKLLAEAFAVMQKHFAEKHESYRVPRKGPVDYVAIAGAIGYGDNLSGPWQFGGPIGSGGFGTCTYWVQVDKNYKVVNREVLKDTYPRNLWDHPGTWHGEGADRKPLESHVVEGLNALPDSEHIIEYHGYRIFADRRMYRIYMEYCEHGTLRDLIKNYETLDKVVREGTVRAIQHHMSRRIPNRFLWSIFEGLAAALCLAHAGGLPGSERNPPALEPVMHRDIKPGNIFLAAPKEEQWPELPVVKLADWGLVCWANKPEANHKGVGTTGWRAPEQYNYRRSQNFPERPSRASDIWAVGRVMLALATRSNNVQRQTFTVPPPYMPDDLVGSIGGPMYDLIRDCLAQSPTSRPDCDGLYTRIAAQVNALKRAPRGRSETLLYTKDKFTGWGR